MTTDSVVPEEDQKPRVMRKDAARNRELLIAAGRVVFARRGLEASLDDVAREAGVGVGTAYRHFENKFELAEAITHEALGEVVVLAEKAARAEDPWAGLVGFIESILELQTHDRGLREVMMRGTSQAHREEAHDRLAEPIGELLACGQRAGVVRADATTSDLGCVMMMANHVADLGGTTRPDLWRRYLPTLLSVLRPDGPQLPGDPLTAPQLQAAMQRTKNW